MLYHSISLKDIFYHFYFKSQASDFIYFAKNITFMAETWLNISHEVREYLHMNTTIMALEGLGKVCHQNKLSKHRVLEQQKKTVPIKSVVSNC